MKMSGPQSIKFLRLKRRLKLAHWQAVGLLEAVWLFTQSNAPNGDIGKLSNEDIAAGIEWDGEPDTLVDDLVASGWIDRCEPHRLVIHDWEEHCPNYLKGNLAKRGEGFAKPNEQVARQAANPSEQAARQTARQTAKQAAQSSQQAARASTILLDCIPADCIPADSSDSKNPLTPTGGTDAVATAPPTTAIDTPKPPPTKLNKTDPDACPRFAEFWSLYPKKASKKVAAVAFAKVKPELFAELLEAVREQKQWPQWLKDEGTFIPHASTWLNQQRWTDRPPEVEPGYVPPKANQQQRFMSRGEREDEYFYRMGRQVAANIAQGELDEQSNHAAPRVVTVEPAAIGPGTG